MKKIFVYLLGILTGVVLTIVVAMVINNSSNIAQVDGLSMFEERGKIMENSSYTIFQTLSDNYALASDWLGTVTVLIIGDENSHFYDNLDISTTPTKKFYQVGTYKYQTKTEDWKTVPVVALLDVKN